jgi:hypothetical protein
MVSGENFMMVSFLTYNMFRSHEHARVNVAVFELIPQNLQIDGDYISHLAHMFAKLCLSDNMGYFTKFNGIVATIDCITTPPTNQGHYAM